MYEGGVPRKALLKAVREHASQRTGENVFKAEGIAKTKALRWEHACCVQETRNTSCQIKYDMPS